MASYRIPVSVAIVREPGDTKCHNLPHSRFREPVKLKSQVLRAAEPIEGTAD